MEVFTYLGSNITSDKEVNNEVAIQLGKALRAFGCLRCTDFQNKQFSVKIKR